VIVEFDAADEAFREEVRQFLREHLPESGAVTECVRFACPCCLEHEIHLHRVASQGGSISASVRPSNRA